MPSTPVVAGPLGLNPILHAVLYARTLDWNKLMLQYITSIRRLNHHIFQSERDARIKLKKIIRQFSRDDALVA
jgi:hypothetical protein